MVISAVLHLCNARHKSCMMADQIVGIDAGEVNAGIAEYHQTTLW